MSNPQQSAVSTGIVLSACMILHMAIGVAILQHLTVTAMQAHGDMWAVLTAE